MSEHEYMAEVRICPLCEMAAHRVPWRDVEGKIAFQCQNAHPTFLEDIPAKAVVKAKVDIAPTRDAVVVLRSGRRIPAPNVLFSPRANWRRAVSLVWNQVQLERHSTSRVVRASIHPADLQYPAIENLWRRLPAALAARTIVTEAQLIPPLSRRAAVVPDRWRNQA